MCTRVTYLLNYSKLCIDGQNTLGNSFRPKCCLVYDEMSECCVVPATVAEKIKRTDTSVTTELEHTARIYNYIYMNIEQENNKKQYANERLKSPSVKGAMEGHRRSHRVALYIYRMRAMHARARGRVNNTGACAMATVELSLMPQTPIRAHADRVSGNIVYNELF